MQTYTYLEISCSFAGVKQCVFVHILLFLLQLVVCCYTYDRHVCHSQYLVLIVTGDVSEWYANVYSKYILEDTVAGGLSTLPTQKRRSLLG